MDDLDLLEKELNEASGISGESKNVETSNSSFGGFSNLFNLGGKSPSATETIKLNSLGEENNGSNLGAATMESVGNTKTWDGFSKVNELPTASAGPRMNDREKRRKKRAMLKKLDEWYEKGHVKHSSNFTMESDFDEV